MNPDSTLRQLHACYCELSLQQPPYSTCERRWFEWHKAGFAEDDLRLVIEYVNRVNKKRSWQFHIPLRFDRFIGDLERFGDCLGSARAERRAREHKAKHSYPAAKAEVLRVTGRVDVPAIPENCISAQEAIKRLRESV